MIVALVLPRRRLWRWHLDLIEALRREHRVEVFLAASPPYPLLVRGWLALERSLSSPKRPRAMRISPRAWGSTAEGREGAGRLLPGGRPSRVVFHALARPLRRLRLQLPIEDGEDGEDGGGPHAFAGFDRVVDLSGGATAEALRPTFDGSTDEMTLIGRLLARGSPHLAVVDGAEAAVAASYAAIEVKDDLGRALGFAQARLIALLLRAVEGRVSPSPIPPARKPARCSAARLALFVARTMRRKIVARLGLAREPHWEIAVRARLPSEGASALPQPGRFEPVDLGRAALNADPCLIERKGRTHLFVETMPYATGRGVVATAELDAQGRPGAFETVMAAAHHLSYPQVFEHDGEVFMIPETAALQRVELHRAHDFPRDWRMEAVLIEGLRIADATLLRRDGLWWLFASVASFGGASQDEVFAFSADALTGPWRPHLKNPVVSDVRAGRPAGRFVERGGRLFRPAQNGEAGYGAGLVWCEVLTLTPDRYEERAVARWTGADFGPYEGVHTYSEAGGFAAVDLRS